MMASKKRFRLGLVGGLILFFLLPTVMRAQVSPYSGSQKAYQGGSVSGLTETNYNDPDWILATSDRILRADICVTNTPPCDQVPNNWYDRIESPPCYAENRFWKLEPNEQVGTAFPASALAIGSLDSLYIKPGVAIQLYQGSDTGNPFGGLQLGPLYVSIDFWRDVIPACDGFEPGTFFVAGSDIGALGNYSISVGSSLCVPNPAACVVDTTQLVYDNRYRYPGCTGSVGCRSAVQLLPASEGATPLSVDFSGVGRPTPFELPEDGPIQRLAWADLDMFGESPLGPIHASINEDVDTIFRSTIAFNSLAPDGDPFFPALMTSVYFFDFRFTDTGIVAFNKDPVIMRSTEAVSEYPPVGIPYTQLSSVELFDRADPDGPALFVLEGITVLPYGEDQEIPLELVLQRKVGNVLEFRARIENPLAFNADFRFVGEGSPDSFSGAIILDPPELAGPGPEDHIVSDVINLAPGESRELTFQVTDTGLGLATQFDLSAIVPNLSVYGETTVFLGLIFQDGFESGSSSAWSAAVP